MAAWTDRTWIEMSEVPPHVARLIRDKTLRAVSRSNTEAMDSIDESYKMPSKVPSISRAVRFLTKICYQQLCSHDLGICMMFILPRGKPKRAVGFFSGWSASKGRLMAGCTSIFLDGQDVQNELVLNLSITRHALERVSQRLESIVSEKLRAEMIPVVTSVIFQMTTGNFFDGHYMARTKHGIAMLVKGDEGIIVTTWISDNMATASQLSGWIKLEKVNSANSGKVTIKTVSDASVFMLK